MSRATWRLPVTAPSSRNTLPPFVDRAHFHFVRSRDCRLEQGRGRVERGQAWNAPLDRRTDPNNHDITTFQATSTDDGQTWPVRWVLEDGDGYCLSNNSRDGVNRELSYPSVCQDATGTVHVAFTYHRRAIRHVRIPADEPPPPPAPPQPSDDELELERDMEYFVEPEEAFTRDEIE